ncbi:MAG: glycosyltransferase [Bacillota bacterium]|nr:glycosyltransferase [Bacillota bacterium]
MKIIILSGKFGMGHFSAAQTLADNISRSGLDVQVELADLYQIALPHANSLLYGSYAQLMSGGGRLINIAYKNAVHDDKGLPRMLTIPQSFLLFKLSAYLEQRQPDVIISTYSLASRIVACYKRMSGSRAALVTCITDIGIHNVWLNRDTELYLAGAEQTRRDLLAAGVPAARIAVSGIPVAAGFAPAMERGERPFELLVSGGGLGLLPADKQLWQALSRVAGLHISVVCGNNQRLRRQLQHLRLDNVSALGYRRDMAQLMRGADMMLCKPGGLSSFEAIHSALPLLMFRPFLEQEIKNCRFILDSGMGELLADDNAAAAQQLTGLIGDRARLDGYRRNMRAFSAGLDSEALLRWLSAYQGGAAA